MIVAPWRGTDQLPGGQALRFPPPASADTSPCTIRNQTFPDWANVTGIASGSYLTVRTGPGSGYDVKDRLANGRLVAVSCYTTGLTARSVRLSAGPVES
ncbi:hypothetical protein SAMN05428985_10141 [Nocardioides sp. YR527]|nr:hypothetical protein SAMN05428985_10141 [Nocardioides sp. YR527]